MTKPIITAHLPVDNTEPGWIRVDIDGRYMGSIWGLAEIALGDPDCPTMVTVKDNGVVAGFLHVNPLVIGEAQ